MGPTLGGGRAGGYVMTLPCLYVSAVHRGGGEMNESAVLAKETPEASSLTTFLKRSLKTKEDGEGGGDSPFNGSPVWLADKVSSSCFCQCLSYPSAYVVYLQYVCTYICMYVCTYVRMYVYVHTYVCMLVHVLYAY